MKQIALDLNLSQKEMNECRLSLLQKLECKTMSRAIIIGIRFGEIKARRYEVAEGFISTYQ